MNEFTADANISTKAATIKGKKFRGIGSFVMFWALKKDKCHVTRQAVELEVVRTRESG